jgi:hypothetical protein
MLILTLKTDILGMRRLTKSLVEKVNAEGILKDYAGTVDPSP